jgi:quercetin dioxygenase-like cupin family protein
MRKLERNEEMRRLTVIILLLNLLISTHVFANHETANETSHNLQTVITKAGSSPSIKGSPEYFTGNVRVDPLFTANESTHYSGAYVTFEPGARTAWHTHPTGQYLIITAGVGLVQEWGGPIREVRAGDVVWIPPGVKHWHGAAPTTAMTHIGLSGVFEGKSVTWLEKVSDDQYGK